MEMVAHRFSVYLVNLDPTVGAEIRKTGPCVIVSPDEMNRHIRTVIVAPLTAAGRNYPTRIPCELNRKKGYIVLDQIRTIDKARLIKNIGTLDSETQYQVSSVLQELFSFS